EEKCYPSGLFTINDEFDFSYALIDYQTARRLLDYPESMSSALEISLDKNADTKKIKTEIETRLGSKFKVQNKFEQNDVLFKVLQTEKLWVFLILAFVLLIASFNI